MGSKMVLKHTLQPAWEIVNKIREEIVDNLKDFSAEIRDSSMITASELIENAVKYGKSAGGKGIEFSMELIDNKIVIKVANGVVNENDLKSVIEHIDKIKGADDYCQLYTDRLVELMNNPKPGVSQLGLYRIAYEAEFELDYRIEDNYIVITASRNNI